MEVEIGEDIRGISNASFILNNINDLTVQKLVMGERERHFLLAYVNREYKKWKEVYPSSPFAIHRISPCVSIKSRGDEIACNDLEDPIKYIPHGEGQILSLAEPILSPVINIVLSEHYISPAFPTVFASYFSPTNKSSFTIKLDYPRASLNDISGTSIILQVMQALGISQQVYKFTHNNLGLSSIMLVGSRDDGVSYFINTEGLLNVVKADGPVVKIDGFENARADRQGTIICSKDHRSVNFGLFDPHYDILTFLGSLAYYSFNEDARGGRLHNLAYEMSKDFGRDKQEALLRFILNTNESLSEIMETYFDKFYPVRSSYIYREMPNMPKIVYGFIREFVPDTHWTSVNEFSPGLYLLPQPKVEVRYHEIENMPPLRSCVTYQEDGNIKMITIPNNNCASFSLICCKMDPSYYVANNGGVAISAGFHTEDYEPVGPFMEKIGNKYVEMGKPLFRELRDKDVYYKVYITDGKPRLEPMFSLASSGDTGMFVSGPILVLNGVNKFKTFAERNKSLVTCDEPDSLERCNNITPSALGHANESLNRTMMCLTKDSIVLVYVEEVRMNQMAEIALRIGAINAIALDSGFGTSLAVYNNGAVYNTKPELEPTGSILTVSLPEKLNLSPDNSITELRVSDRNRNLAVRTLEDREIRAAVNRLAPEDRRILGEQHRRMDMHNIELRHNLLTQEIAADEAQRNAYRNNWRILIDNMRAEPNRPGKQINIERTEREVNTELARMEENLLSKHERLARLEHEYNELRNRT